MRQVISHIFSIGKNFDQVNSVAEITNDQEFDSEVSVFEYVIREE